MMKDLCKEVWRMNLELAKNNLVFGTQGNVSGIDRKKRLVVIKPSGVSYSQLKEKDMVIVNLKGEVVGGRLRPSVDLPHHLYIYQRMKEIGGVVHTHSPYATVFAIVGKPIPVLTTAHADLFGKEIPVSPYVDNQSNHIGKAILNTVKEGCSAVILGKHGVFTFAETPKEATTAAILVEYCAKTSFCALLLSSVNGEKRPRPLLPKEIKKWYNRYHKGGYGQEVEKE